MDGLWTSRKIKIDIASLVAVKKVKYSKYILNGAVYNLHLKGTIRFYTRGTDAVELTDKEKAELKNNVVEVVNAGSEIYKSAINRKIANHKQALLRQKQYRLNKKKEIQELNELFKKKNYLLE